MRGVVWIVCLLLGSGGCGGDGYGGLDDHEGGQADPVVGASCSHDDDCLGLCARGDKFPRGFCTLACVDDADCTVDTVCITTEGGVCAFPCAGGGDSYCRGLLDAGYECDDKENFYDEEIHVCIGDD
jgi:hypothetical protein